MAVTSTFARVVLNARGPGVAAAGAGPELGAALAAGMLRAVGAHRRDDGRVDYAALRASGDFADACVVAARLPGLDLQTLAERRVRLAFWINVYNALALHGVVALGPRRSVREVWNFFGRVSYRIGGILTSLDEIEHGILRANRRRVFPPWPVFRRGDARGVLACTSVDPRLHAALNCGAAACPPIRVFRAEVIDDQLDLAARSLVNQEVVLGADGRIACSKLFRWYRADFEGAGGLGAFVARYLDDGPVKAALAAGRPPCAVFRRYSWALAHPPVE